MTPAQLREARLGLGLTQGQLADSVGRDIKTVNNWECGRSQIPAMIELVFKELKRALRRTDKDNVS